VLDLAAAAGEAVARSPGANSELRVLRLDRPRAPPDRAAREADAIVLARRADAAAEVGVLRPVPRREELGERGLELAREARPLPGECQQVRVRGGMKAPEKRQDLVADQPASRVRIRRVAAELEARGAAVPLGLLPPGREQRPDDAILAPRLDRLRRAARDKPIKDGLDLVGGGVAGRAEAVARVRVPDVTELGLRHARPGRDDLGAERLGAEARVLLGLVAAQSVVHVQRGDAVADRTQGVPEARRIRTARDETEHVAAGWDQLMRSDERFDPAKEIVHPGILPGRQVSRPNE